MAATTPSDQPHNHLHLGSAGLLAKPSLQDPSEMQQGEGHWYPEGMMFHRGGANTERALEREEEFLP